jgi:hypothetical protein
MDMNITVVVKNIKKGKTGESEAGFSGDSLTVGDLTSIGISTISSIIKKAAKEAGEE